MNRAVIVFIAIGLGLGVWAPVISQAHDRTLKITTVEPETERAGICPGSDGQGGMLGDDPLHPLPVDLTINPATGESSRGYTQACTFDIDPGPAPFPPGPGTWELATNRWLPGANVVRRGQEVVLEIYGVRGRDHRTRIFKQFSDDPADRVALDTCRDADTDVPLENCAFVAKRGEVIRVAFVAEDAGTYVMHCQTHAPAMDMDIIVLPQETRTQSRSN